jgi:putative membrane protein
MLGAGGLVAGFILRMVISAFGLWLAAKIVPGVAIRGVDTLAGAALLLGIVNAVVRPVAVLLTLPFTILTLGLFLLAVNAAMLGLVAALLDGFALAGFGPALLASIVVSLTSWIASWYIGPSGRFEILVVESRER